MWLCNHRKYVVQLVRCSKGGVVCMIQMRVTNVYVVVGSFILGLEI